MHTSDDDSGLLCSQVTHDQSDATPAQSSVCDPQAAKCAMRHRHLNVKSTIIIVIRKMALRPLINKQLSINEISWYNNNQLQ